MSDCIETDHRSTRRYISVASNVFVNVRARRRSVLREARQKVIRYNILQKVNKEVMELARKAVYCGPVEVNGETQDDMVLYLHDGADRRKRSSSI